MQLLCRGDIEQFVFVDEAGFKRTPPQRGHALVGRDVPYLHRFNRGAQHNLIMAYWARGPLTYVIDTRKTTAAVFDQFMVDYLLPELQPFGGGADTIPCSAVVLDGAPFHYGKFRERNPIELAFGALRKRLARLVYANPGGHIPYLIVRALDMVTAHEAQRTVRRSGYYLDEHGLLVDRPEAEWSMRRAP